MDKCNLKPCPLCGGKMKVDYRLKPLKYAVVHISNFSFSDGCYGGTDYEFDTEEQAIESWNRRANNEDT